MLRQPDSKLTEGSPGLQGWGGDHRTSDLPREREDCGCPMGSFPGQWAVCTQASRGQVQQPTGRRQLARCKMESSFCQLPVCFCFPSPVSPLCPSQRLGSGLMPLGWTGFAFGAIVLACVLADGVGTLTSLGRELTLSHGQEGRDHCHYEISRIGMSRHQGLQTPEPSSAFF